LTLCRHKGAIEAAGLSIGRLTRAITSSLESGDAGFQMLHDCLERKLLTESRQVSTTRRGAGFAIMFLHVLKNDNPRQRLLLHRAVQQILQKLNGDSSAESVSLDSNHDRLEALVLHYLCVQVRQLAATCFVRSHEFRCDLPAALLASAKLAANLEEENFYEGLIYTLTSGVLKLQHEARHVWSAGRLEKFFAISLVH